MSPDLKPLDYKTVGCFGGHGLSKASRQSGQSEKIPHENGGRDPPIEMVRAATEEWQEHLKACVEA